MKLRNLAISIGSSVAFLILILDSKTAIQGISDGLALCVQTLIPSLFPFFIFSTLLTSALSGQTLTFLKPIATVLNLPKGSESLLAIGFLGGYPVGAQSVAMLHQKGQLSIQQATKLIVICNNAGPAFLFGVLGQIFTNRYTPWLLWLIHMASALLVGLILRDDVSQELVHPTQCRIEISKALERSVKTMALVCAWVMFMRMVINFLTRWFLWLLPTSIQIIICSVLELSNGCMQLKTVDNEALQFILASSMLALGGICVALQTYSVAPQIPMKLYFPGKILQCSFSLFLSCVSVPFIFPDRSHNIALPIVIAGIIGLIPGLILNYYKNNSRISALSGV